MAISIEIFCACDDNAQEALEVDNEAVCDAPSATKTALEAIGDSEVIGGTTSRGHVDQDIKVWECG